MRRIAITGMGIASCLGNDLDTGLRSDAFDQLALKRRDSRRVVIRPGKGERGDRHALVPEARLDGLRHL